jgi:hypothetical protein
VTAFDTAESKLSRVFLAALEAERGPYFNFLELSRHRVSR